MATMWRESGEVVLVLPADLARFAPSELGSLLGGPIERVRLDANSVMIVNEGRGTINWRATRLLRELRDGWACVVGDALVCSNAEAGDG